MLTRIYFSKFIFQKHQKSTVLNFLSLYIETIYSTNYAFAAKTEEGNVITWGNPVSGGVSNSVRMLLDTNSIKCIYTSATSFAAITEDKKVITWGANCYEGDDDSFLKTK